MTIPPRSMPLRDISYTDRELAIPEHGPYILFIVLASLLGALIAAARVLGHLDSPLARATERRARARARARAAPELTTTPSMHASRGLAATSPMTRRMRDEKFRNPMISWPLWKMMAGGFAVEFSGDDEEACGDSGSRAG